MANAGSVLDQYDQVAIVGYNLAAATSGSSLTQLVTGLTNMQKMAWKVHRIEYFIPRIAATHLSVAGNFLKVALAAGGNAASPTVNVEAAIIYDSIMVESMQAPGTPAGYSFLQTPIVHSFTEEQALLVLTQNVYMVTEWISNGAMASERVVMRLHYKEVSLGPQDWYDLLQMRMPLGAV